MIALIEDAAMYQSTLKKVGGSTMFAIPKAILEILDLHANETVGLSVADGKLVIEKRPPAEVYPR